MTMDQDFPVKVAHCGHVFFFCNLEWSFEEDDTIMSKVVKGKGKIFGKN